MRVVLKLIVGAGLMGGAIFAFAQETFPVPLELWDRPRSGQIVLGQPAIKQAANACLSQPGVSLILHHAAGQEPLLQAEELRAWMIALAIGAERIGLRSDLKSGESLKIEVVRNSK